MKLRTLYDCRNHWQWLWITGSIDKDSYEPSEQWEFNCACCEFMEHRCKGLNKNKEYICDDCPLTGYAWCRCLSRSNVPCDAPNTNSYYYGWKTSETKEERQYYAHKMVMACNRAIEEFIKSSVGQGSIYYKFRNSGSDTERKELGKQIVKSCFQDMKDILLKEATK